MHFTNSLVSKLPAGWLTAVQFQSVTNDVSLSRQFPVPSRRHCLAGRSQSNIDRSSRGLSEVHERSGNSEQQKQVKMHSQRKKLSAD